MGIEGTENITDKDDFVGYENDNSITLDELNATVDPSKHGYVDSSKRRPVDEHGRAVYDGDDEEQARRAAARGETEVARERFADDQAQAELDAEEREAERARLAGPPTDGE